jgi:type I restriction enzyme R subunit
LKTPSTTVYPRAYTKDVYHAKCNAVFEHVYEAYRGEGQSLYNEAA